MNPVKSSKQEVMNKILSFKYDELADWVKARLHGDDRYFPIHEGYETNLSEFLVESFTHIKDEKFRENFLEILNDLTTELWAFTPEQVENDRNYVYELLSLCGAVKQFENKSTLYRVARSSKLKGYYAYDLELHQLLLTVLASYQTAGDHEFWIEQMLDDSNKYYANAAFYALLNRKYDLDILFRNIGTFINRFKGEIDLELGIEALIEEYNVKEIVKRFKKIEPKLSNQQKRAINEAFVEVGYPVPYKTFATKIRKLYGPLAPTASVAGEKKAEYGTHRESEEIKE